MAKEINNTDVGNDVFQILRDKDYYYIDKSLFIKEFIEIKGRVNLITRPRRFGKSLNLSMLKSYLEIGANPSLFKGLAIEGEREIYDAHFGKYPVLHLSLAASVAPDFEAFLKYLSSAFKYLFTKDLKYLLNSDKLSLISKDNIEKFIRPPEIPDEAFLSYALESLTVMLNEHFGKNVVILIDEYDSIVTHAIVKGYEKRLLEFLSSFFGRVFKGNVLVEFIVLTGCLRIAKESIFTGANNLVVSTVSDPEFSGMFGLTEEEVSKILNDFGLSSKLDSFREWYNGYLFDDKQIYNTSSVISYCRALKKKITSKPKNYWANSSANEILLDVINKSECDKTLPDLEKLLLGGSIEIGLFNDITMEDFNDTSSLWCILVHTGYLTPSEQDSDEYLIPNKEVQKEFLSKVVKWVKTRIGTNVHSKIIEAIWSKNASVLQELLDKVLMTKISYFDEYEYCYHMLLLGLMADVDAVSNRESGNGRTDITLRKGGKYTILELKKSYDELYMTADALKGIMQIKDRFYGKDLEIKGFPIIHYGISFYKKGCLVILESEITKELIEEAIGDMEAIVWAIGWQINKRASTAVKSPSRKAWYKSRKRALESFKDSLDKESYKFDFAKLLANAEKLLDDLKWLLTTETTKDSSQTLLQAMLTQTK
ncbi:MAG: ATP-binding protein [Clostridiales bacterium]|nr:ATP-binding protein [Clostridiales bacterium]